MGGLTVQITKKTEEADGIVSFELAAVDGTQLPSFSAGAHIDVHLGNGMIRSYSLCNPPSENHRYLIAVLRDPSSRGGSIAMHALAEGGRLEISEPRNHFSLVPAAHTILLAGGIGVTPLLCMAEELTATDASFEMHYCTRTGSRTAFARRIANSPFAHKVYLHHDDGNAAQAFHADIVLGHPNPGVQVYICGPTGFIDHVLATALAHGWPNSQLHQEYFSALPLDTADDGSFQVQIASTGAIYTIPADRGVAAVLIENGLPIELSCQQGVCGSCITRVLEGVCDHRDLILSPDEQAANDQFTPCCSRAKSPRLVLDL